MNQNSIFSSLLSSSLIVPPSWWGWRSSLQLFLVLNPIVGVSVGRVNKFWNYFVVCLHNKDSARVFVLPAVVCGWEHCDQWSACESFEPVHDAFMSTDYHAQIVLFEELLDSVRAELNYVAGLWRISQMIGDDTKLGVWLSWVWPQNIQDNLWLFILDLVHDL